MQILEGYKVVIGITDWTDLVKKLYPEAAIETNGNHHYAVLNGKDVGFYGSILGYGRVKESE